MGKISMPQGKGSQLHNRRDYESIGREMPLNIDQRRTNENITIIDINIKQAYEEIFGEALQRYNANQKRKDRLINSYYDHIAKSKNGEKLFYEDVIQWGRKEDFENNPLMREKAKNALLEYAQTFQRRNPNLRVIGAYIHMDEASPHLHLDYIPVAHGYSRGLDTRNSLDRAMQEMGFETISKKDNATKAWKENERAFFGTLCQIHGLDVEPERESHRKQLSPEEYRKLMASVQKDKKDLEEEIERLKKDKDDLKSFTNAQWDDFFAVIIKQFTDSIATAHKMIQADAEANTLKNAITVIRGSEQFANNLINDIHTRANKTSEQLDETKEIMKESVKEFIEQEISEVEQTYRHRKSR